ncbi:MAG: cardiolipin synthase [Filimonas sp.]|nr:cardiolipin synthase [Filimonas sp.]
MLHHIHFGGIITIIIVAAYILSIFFGLLIISQNRTPAKTLAYLILFFSLPVIGILIYYIFGENYRKKKLYKKKYLSDRKSFDRYSAYLIRLSEEIIKDHVDQLRGSEQIARMMLNDSRLPISINNNVELLINGEEKFAKLFEELEKAEHHIHLEYYIMEQGHITLRLKDILIRKAKQGVAVRMMYDDFGTSIKYKHLRDLKKAGVQAMPFYKIIFPIASSRHNYRDHRKVVIIDGKRGFTGGINMSDRYSNEFIAKNKMYWRDTHLFIEGDAIKPLQYLFFLNWNFCSKEELPVTHDYFPDHTVKSNQLVQISYSGPDSDRASIMMSYFAAITKAKHYIYISTPYFIPNESLLTALQTAALGKVDVRLLVPGVSDSTFVNAAAHSYYEDLLEAGVKIYLYQKGFMHAKTMVSDNCLSMVGSANMDIRSFDLNFELNAVVYDRKIHDGLKAVFMRDLQDSVEITLEEWSKRNRLKKLGESTARIFSSIM